MKKVILTGALAACCGVSAAFAHDTDGMSKDAMMKEKTQYYFSKMDADGNGSVSKAEHDNFANSMFVKADANNDGMLSLSELSAAKMKEHEEMRASMGGSASHYGSPAAGGMQNPTKTPATGSKGDKNR